VMECDVVVDSSISDGYTLKTPARTLDPTKPWKLIVNTASADLDNANVLVDIWAGFDDDFALTGNADPIATSGGEVATAVMDDVKIEPLTVIVDPNYHGTMVQSSTGVVGIVNVGTAPYYAFNLDGDTFKSATCHFVIVQD
ncbi:hypothetical protein LCGC14_2098300, partial [marine sediment metagenome]